MKMRKKEIARRLKRGILRFIRAPLKPELFWIAIRSAIKLLPGESVERLTSHLCPKGNPGAGVFRGRHNINKALTYRAVRNLDFNVERNARRAAMASVILMRAGA